ncbi:MAG TPA: hypothetical protein EYH40_00305 [Desulfurococcales archaeon]|nr:hypothetical protein [Desulfurococcales archaeon]
MNKKVKILLDTNTLILSVKYGLDIFTHIEETLLRKCSFYVLNKTLVELENLKKKGRPLEKKIATIALKLVKDKCNIINVQPLPGETVDDIIVRVVYENKMILITNDRELRSRISALGLPVGWINPEEKRVKIKGYYD